MQRYHKTTNRGGLHPGKLFLAISLVLLSFSGCNREPSGPTNRTADSQDSELSTLPTQMDFLADDGIFDEMQATIDRLEALPTFHCEGLPVDTNSFYADISGGHAVEELSQAETPGQQEPTVFYQGEAPWYDVFYVIEQYSNYTSLSYQTNRFSYVNAVFSPMMDAESLSDEALPFATQSDVLDQLDAILSTHHIDLANVQCQSLSAETLQELYDTKKASGTLTENRWGDGSTPYKNHADTAEREVWEDDDACYYITASQGVQGVPLYGEDSITMMVDESGIFSFNAILRKMTQEDDQSKLADVAKLMQVLNDTANCMPSNDGCTLEKIAICYYPVDDTTYIPAWAAVLSYDFTTPDNVIERRETEIVLDARTGAEIPQKEITE